MRAHTFPRAMSATLARAARETPSARLAMSEHGTANNEICRDTDWNVCGSIHHTTEPANFEPTVLFVPVTQEKIALHWASRVFMPCKPMAALFADFTGTFDQYFKLLVNYFDKLPGGLDVTSECKCVVNMLDAENATVRRFLIVFVVQIIRSGFVCALALAGITHSLACIMQSETNEDIVFKALQIILMYGRKIDCSCNYHFEAMMDPFVRLVVESLRLRFPGSKRVQTAVNVFDFLTAPPPGDVTFENGLPIAGSVAPQVHAKVPNVCDSKMYIGGDTKLFTLSWSDCVFGTEPKMRELFQHFTGDLKLYSRALIAHLEKSTNQEDVVPECRCVVGMIFTSNKIVKMAILNVLVEANALGFVCPFVCANVIPALALTMETETDTDLVFFLLVLVNYYCKHVCEDEHDEDPYGKENIRLIVNKVALRFAKHERVLREVRIYNAFADKRTVAELRHAADAAAEALLNAEVAEKERQIQTAAKKKLRKHNKKTKLFQQSCLQQSEEQVPDDELKEEVLIPKPLMFVSKPAGWTTHSTAGLTPNPYTTLAPPPPLPLPTLAHPESAAEFYASIQKNALTHTLLDIGIELTVEDLELLVPA